MENAAREATKAAVKRAAGGSDPRSADPASREGQRGPLGEYVR